MNNAVYGKAMEDVRGHIDFEPVDTPERREKLLNAPTLKHRHTFNKYLVGVEKIKAVMELNKPIYVGLSILDLFKLHVYQFYYDVMKHKYEDKAKLLYTDTGSDTFHMETYGLYIDFKDIDTHMGFSGYEKHILTMIITNKKVLGKFKDGHDGNIFAEHIGLKPKMYCCANGYRQALQQKGKGISRTIVKQELSVQNTSQH